VRFLPAAMMLLLCAAPALAGEDIPPPDEVRFIDRHGASSDCIGDTSTPLCAVETWLACKVRQNPELCGLVDRRHPRGVEWLFIDRLEYWVLGARTAKSCSIVTQPDFRFRCPEDTLTSTIRIHERGSRGLSGGLNTYRLLPDNEEWGIVEILTGGRSMQLYQSPEEGLY